MYSLSDSEARVRSLIGQLEIEKWGHRQINELSRGIQQRAAIARALIHSPSLLLIDEPETGLDPSALELLHKVLNEQMKIGCTIIGTSHNLNLAINNSTRIAILSNGQLDYVPDNPKPEFSTLIKCFNRHSDIKHETIL